jgi:hypothetical protein
LWHSRTFTYYTGQYIVYNNGAGIGTGLTWDTNKKFYLVYNTDGTIKHWNGSTLLYSVSYGVSQTVYIDSSFYSPNATYGGFSNLRAIKKAWNGTSYTL